MAITRRLQKGIKTSRVLFTNANQWQTQYKQEIQIPGKLKREAISEKAGSAGSGLRVTKRMATANSGDGTTKWAVNKAVGVDARRDSDVVLFDACSALFGRPK